MGSRRCSASLVSTMMLMRRLAAAVGLASSCRRLDASPSTRTSLSSDMPPATSSRREALARSAESSQLL
ncbi:hypothetical protein D3C87_2062950 [compost metagenome]